MNTNLTTIIVKDENFKTVGLSMRTENLSFKWGVDASAPGYYIKTVTGKYFQEFVQLYEIVCRNATFMNMRSYFFDVVTKTFGEDAINGVTFDISALNNGLRELERRELAIINSIQ